MLDQLRAAGSGLSFDMAYQQAQIEAHQQAIQLMQNYAASGDVPALRTVAVRRHSGDAEASVDGAGAGDGAAATAADGAAAAAPRRRARLAAVSRTAGAGSAGDC